MIRITPQIAIDEREFRERFIRAAGPGGQNVNKVATAVQLRFDVAAAASLSDDVKVRLGVLARRRINRLGVLVIEARRYRTRERNRRDAIERLVHIIRRAATPPKRRRPTAVPKASKIRRLESKRRRAGLKRIREPATRED
jgi:ribosome-associated protein